MLKGGAELALRMLSFPTPVVAACNGNAYAMGAFLILSADLRIAAEGPYKTGMNEVAIGLTVPTWAIEVTRQRLTPAYFSRSMMTGELFALPEAVMAGFFDRTVPAPDLDAAADQAAEALSKISMPAHAATKMRARPGEQSYTRRYRHRNFVRRGAVGCGSQRPCLIVVHAGRWQTSCWPLSINGPFFHRCFTRRQA